MEKTQFNHICPECSEPTFQPFPYNQHSDVEADYGEKWFAQCLSCGYGLGGESAMSGWSSEESLTRFANMLQRKVSFDFTPSEPSAHEVSNAISNRHDADAYLSDFTGHNRSNVLFPETKAMVLSIASKDTPPFLRKHLLSKLTSLPSESTVLYSDRLVAQQRIDNLCAFMQMFANGIGRHEALIIKTHERNCEKRIIIKAPSYAVRIGCVGVSVIKQKIRRKIKRGNLWQ